jgi:hypothetical protein
MRLRVPHARSPGNSGRLSHGTRDHGSKFSDAQFGLSRGCPLDATPAAPATFRWFETSRGSNDGYCQVTRFCFTRVTVRVSRRLQPGRAAAEAKTHRRLRRRGWLGSQPEHGASDPHGTASGGKGGGVAGSGGSGASGPVPFPTACWGWAVECCAQPMTACRDDAACAVRGGMVPRHESGEETLGR